MPAKILERFAARPIVRQFARFAMVGAVATAAHYALMIVLIEAADVPVVPATSAGYALGTVVSYLLNRSFTFSVKTGFTRGFVKYAIVIGAGFFINGAIVWALSRAGLPYMLAQVIATGLVLIWNFAGARLVVFR